MSRKFPIWIAAIVLTASTLIGVSYCGLKKVQDLDSLAESIAEKFPDVEHIPTFTLAKLLQIEGDSLLLVDCRNPEEYEVSHIPGAVNLQDPEAVAGALAARQDPPEKIAVYCAVGYRSAKLAEALEKAGVENVVNIRGSIFAWANEDRPLEKAESEPADKVHPFNEFWSRLLKEDKRATFSKSIDP